MAKHHRPRRAFAVNAGHVDNPYPLVRRAAGRAKYHVALIAFGGCALAWVVAGLVSFALRRARARTDAAVVVGYEKAGGSEKVRVRLLRDGRPAEFMLLEAESAWPRYAADQKIEVLTWPVANPLGQKVQAAMAYAPGNYWRKPLVVSGCGMAAIGAGVLGLRGQRRRRHSDGQSPPPIPREPGTS